MRLEGKVAVVSGGARGIGAVYARALCAAGASVVCADIDAEAVDAAARALTADGFDAMGAVADISDEASTGAMAQAAVDRFGGIDILVNNAAIYHGMRMDPLMDVPLEYWRRVFSVNLDGTLLATRAVVPHMRARGGGAIVNQASVAAFTPGNHYNISKLAVVGLTLGLARELGRFNIRVNAIAPGPISTEATEATIPAEQLDAIVRALVIRRRGTPEDLVGLLLLLVSDDAAWMTGQTIRVDGGMVLVP